MNETLNYCKNKKRRRETLMKLKKGDKVIVLSGNDKGKTGEVLEVIPKTEKIIVKGVNIRKKHVKARKQGEESGIISVECAIPSSKVNIVCPKCETSAIIENDDNLRLRVINCGNFHRVSNVNYDKLEEFEEHLFDMSVENQEKLKCNICNYHKINITPPEDQFYICSCGANLCKQCLITHNEPKHYKFEVENKNYKCFIHGKEFNSYCIDCNMNICELCNEDHPEHEILKYQHLKPKNSYIE